MNDALAGQVPPKDFRVSVPVVVDLTEAEREWMADNPTLANATLSAWYGHNRACRRAHRKAGRRVMEPVTCRCAR